MSLEDHKSEIEDWDLGAGIYISFYLLRSSLQCDEDDINKLVSISSFTFILRISRIIFRAQLISTVYQFHIINL